MKSIIFEGVQTFLTLTHPYILISYSQIITENSTNVYLEKKVLCIQDSVIMSQR